MVTLDVSGCTRVLYGEVEPAIGCLSVKPALLNFLRTLLKVSPEKSPSFSPALRSGGLDPGNHGRERKFRHSREDQRGYNDRCYRPLRIRLINRIIPRIPIQVLPALIPNRIPVQEPAGVGVVVAILAAEHDLGGGAGNDRGALQCRGGAECADAPDGVDAIECVVAPEEALREVSLRVEPAAEAAGAEAVDRHGFAVPVHLDEGVVAIVDLVCRGGLAAVGVR
jgi:hypothetical protein